MTLPISNVVNVSISIAALAAGPRSFGSLLIVGATDGVIDAQERIREYASAESVGADFGIESEEYKAALVYFSQSPKPRNVYIGRWVKSETSGVLKGAPILEDDNLEPYTTVPEVTAITDGSLKITIDGNEVVATGLNFNGSANFNAIAFELTQKLGTASVTWDDVYKRFEITSLTKGSGSSVGYASAHTEGTDLSAVLGLRADQASTPVDGRAPESHKEALNALINKSLVWYGAYFAEQLTDEQVLDLAAITEAASPSRVFGCTVTNPLAKDQTSKVDLAYKLSEKKYRRTFALYSSDNDHAAVSVFGRAFTVNYYATNSTITLKFKQLPGIASEDLEVSQATALTKKKCNVFAGYNNDTSILQEGVMCSGDFIDEVFGLDWLQNHLETAVWNLYYTSTTKVPQTPAGVNRTSSVLERACEQAVTNGLLGEGQWNGDSFGVLQTGDYLTKGFYVFANSLDNQPQSEREARKSPVSQIAAKLAGATHFTDVTVLVNR